MSGQSIKLTIDKRSIATLTLNRPEVHNAVSLEMIREMRKIITELNSDPEPRGVILTGVGKTFCAGMDLRWMQKISTQNRANRIAEATELSEMLNELDRLNKPLIGKINGHSFGGAIGLISCCDFSVAAEDAEFSLVAKAVSSQSLEEEIEKEITALLRCAPEAVSSTKSLISEVRGKEPQAVREYTIEKLADAWETESVKEGIDAFFSKRRPAWSQ